jgi:hypothetical protein
MSPEANGSLIRNSLIFLYIIDFTDRIQALID